MSCSRGCRRHGQYGMICYKSHSLQAHLLEIPACLGRRIVHHLDGRACLGGIRLEGREEDLMRLYYITDRKQLRDDELLAVIGRALSAGVDLVQIREKDLTAHELFELTKAAMRLPNPESAKILVNARADVALAAGAHGVHLPAHSMPVAEIRRVSPPRFLVAVSCHSVGEVRAAASEAADFAVFGPVFETASKASYGPPQGLDKLAQACRAVPIPVLALGGLGLANAADCLAAGAAGIAGISVFQRGGDLDAVTAALRATRR